MSVFGHTRRHSTGHPVSALSDETKTTPQQEPIDEDRKDNERTSFSSSSSSSFIVREIPAVWRTGVVKWTFEGEDLGLTASEGKGDARVLRKSSEDRDVRTLFQSLFLPSGYPDSVTGDYYPWLTYHLGSLFIRDVLEVLASQSLLLAVTAGGSAAAVVAQMGPNTSAMMAAATKWVLKDGFGSLATLTVGSRGGQAFDEDPKRYWVVCSAGEDVARLVEILLPLQPQFFLAGAGLATFVRSGSLVGRNSLVNGTLIRHFGKRENMSDIRAKLEAQGRILKIASLPVGIALFRWTQSLDQHQGGHGLGLGFTLIVYAALFFSHNYCCYKAAQSLTFANLSAFRLKVTAGQFLQDGKIESPEQVAEAEGVYKRRGDLGIVVGTNFQTFHEQSCVKDWGRLQAQYDDQGYLLTIAKGNRSLGMTSEEGGKEGNNGISGLKCLVLLKTGYTDEDLIQAVLQSQLLMKKKSDDLRRLEEDLLTRVLEESLVGAKAQVEEYQQALLEANWQLKVVRGAWNTIALY